VEIQDREPLIPIPLEKIGFRGVRRRITLNTPEGPLALDLTLDLLVSIGDERRGAHLSRNIEALDLGELLVEERPRSLEDYLKSVARRLLDLHDYAYKAEARAKTVYYARLEYVNITGLEPVDVDVRVEVSRSGEELWSTRVTVAGMSVCPSAQETIARLTGGSPAPSHVQRVYLSGRATTRGEMVRIEDVAAALSQSFSAPAFTLLKRMDEARLVLEAHRNPKFAEDIAREALLNMARILSSKLNGDAVLEAEVVSLESIHPHNVYAYARGTLRSLLHHLEGSLRKSSRNSNS